MNYCILFVIIAVSCEAQNAQSQDPITIIKNGKKMTINKIIKSDNEWKKELDPFVYHIVREKGTERPFTGLYNDNKAEGDYHCVACDTKLFDSKYKYDSGSGWPSFFDVPEKTLISEELDRSHYMSRTEVTCAVCSAHLGHLFEDGPEPTGLRYCINSASLKFKQK